MNAVIGIDPEQQHQCGPALFSRIGFRDPMITLLSVLKPISLPVLAPTSAPLCPVYDYCATEHLRDWQEKAAYVAQASVQRQLKSQGFRTCETVRIGSPAEELLACADELNADLVVTSPENRDRCLRVFLGSVSRTAVIAAKQSVLLAKADIPEGKPCSVVFATDHSEYCDKALNRLLSFRPTGIRNVTVLTALRAGFSQERSPMPHFTPLPEIREEWREQALLGRCEQVADKFWRLRIQATPRVVDSTPSNAIDEVMRETKADLLILAAQGHGFWERVRIGSLSLHEAMNQRHSLLILRP